MISAKHLEAVIVVLVLIVFSGALFPVIVAGDLPDNAVLPDGPRSILGEVTTLTYAIMACLVIARPGEVLGVFVRHAGLSALVLLALASSLWSIDPSISLRKAVGFGISTAFGAYLGSQLPLDRLLRLIVVAIGLCLVLSLIFILIAPGLGIMGYWNAGDWRGVFLHKNGLGQYATLNLVAILALYPIERRYRWLLLADAALSVVLLVGSGSRTAFLVGAVLFGVFVLIRTVRRSPGLIVPCLPLVIGAALLLALNIDPLLGLLGRDLTFSGRVELWNALWDMIRLHWVLGYGFQAFWVSPDGPILDLWSRLTWQAPNAHNGFLDIWLGLGIGGLITFLAVFGQAFAIGWVRLGQMSRPAAYWIVGYLSYFLLYGFDEINYLQPNGSCWILFVATTVLALRVSVAARMEKRQPVRKLALKSPARVPIGSSSVR
jgi:O-antigen ligase